MKKALKRACDVMESSEVPSDKVIDSIVIQSHGDIKSALNNLQFTAQSGSKSLSTSVVQKNKKAKRAAAAKISEGIGRENTLGVFHGLGKVLHPKKEMDQDTKKMKFANLPEDIADKFHSECGKFTELIHSNYVNNFGHIQDAANFCNILSVTDKIPSDYEATDQISLLNLDMVVRGAMVFNENWPGGFPKISQYASKKYKKIETDSLQWFNREAAKYFKDHVVSKRDFFMDFNTFSKILK
jgi:hypothetical protein